MLQHFKRINFSVDVSSPSCFRTPTYERTFSNLLSGRVIPLVLPRCIGLESVAREEGPSKLLTSKLVPDF